MERGEHEHQQRDRDEVLCLFREIVRCGIKITVNINLTQRTDDRGGVSRQQVEAMEVIQERLMKAIDAILAEAGRNTNAEASAKTLFARFGALIEKAIGDEVKLAEIANTFKTNNEGFAESIVKGTSLADRWEAEPTVPVPPVEELPPLPA